MAIFKNSFSLLIATLVVLSMVIVPVVADDGKCRSNDVRIYLVLNC